MELIISVLTIATAIIALMEFRDHLQQIRTDRLILADKTLRQNSNQYRGSAAADYRAQYQDRPEIGVEYLVYDRRWMGGQPGVPLLRPLEEIPVRLLPDRVENADFSQEFPLPLPQNTLVENVALHCGKNLYDHPTFGLDPQTFSGDGLCLRLGGFYDYFNTCGCLEYESAYAALFRRTPLARRKVGDLFTDQTRFPAVGICTMTVIKNLEPDGGAVFLMHKRAGSVAGSSGMIDVIPAGMFQPVSWNVTPADLESRDGAPARISLKRNVLREYAEELQGQSEFLDAHAVGAEGGSPLDQVYFLGMGYNPLSTHVELLTVGVVDAALHPEYQYFGTHPGGVGADAPLKLSWESGAQVTALPLRISTLRQYQAMANTTCALRQIFSVAADHFPEFCRTLGVPEQG